MLSFFHVLSHVVLKVLDQAKSNKHADIWPACICLRVNSREFSYVGVPKLGGDPITALFSLPAYPSCTGILD